MDRLGLDGTSPRSALLRAALVLALVLALSLSVLAAPGDVALQRVAGDFSLPVFVIGDPSDPERLFVVELAGRIKVVVDGVTRKKPLLNIRSQIPKITDEDEEYGLFSIAFHPKWPKKRFLFVAYTNLDGNTVIARFKVNRKRTKAKKKSEKQLLEVVQPQTWHNGGQIQIPADGHLYVGLGDGGDDFDTGAAAQDLRNLLGTILRYKIAKKKLKIPKDNPVLPKAGKSAIWAFGLRNPWRFSFDRETGDLYIGDVGEDAREEIDFLAAGSEGGTNFGWPIREGSVPFNGAVKAATTPLVGPIYEYSHAVGSSITGGFVYRGLAIPDLLGYYVFGDWGASKIFAFRVENGKAVGVMELSGKLLNDDGETPTVVSFGEDADGELYVCDFFAGVVYRIVPAS